MKSLDRHFVHRRPEPEHALLKCPKCPNRLRPLLLNMFEERGKTYQRVWWTCRGLKSKTCIFPLNMPTEVFWTRRTQEQIQHNVIPLPNYNLMPKPLRYMYPTLFKNQSVSPQKAVIPNPGRSVSPISAVNAVVREEASEQPSTESQDLSDNETEGFTSIKKLENSRKRKRGRPPKEKTPEIPNSRRKFNGIVSTGPKCALTPSEKKNRRHNQLDESEVRRLTGGQNFDYALVDEVIEPNATSSRMELFPDVRTSLKSALAIRFAKKEVLDRVTDRMCENGIMSTREVALVEHRRLLQKVSEEFPLIVDEPRRSTPILPEETSNKDQLKTPSRSGSVSRSSDSNSMTNSQTGMASTAASNSFNAFRQAEHQLSIVARLGHRKKASEIAALALRTPVSSKPLRSTRNVESQPSTSTASLEEETVTSHPKPNNLLGEFDSPELSTMVNRHLQMLQDKKLKKARRKSKPRTPQPTEIVESNLNYGYEHGEFDPNAFNHQVHYNFENDTYHFDDTVFDQNAADDPYGIFSLDGNNEFDDFNFAEETDAFSSGLNPPF